MAKSVVDRLERDLQGQAIVLRLNVRDAAGKDVMRAYEVYLVPTFLVFDGAGNLLFRQGGAFPDVGMIKDRVRGVEGNRSSHPTGAAGQNVLIG